MVLQMKKSLLKIRNELEPHDATMPSAEGDDKACGSELCLVSKGGLLRRLSSTMLADEDAELASLGHEQRQSRKLLEEIQRKHHQTWRKMLVFQVKK
mmetsp:Transcript_9175/g.15949  ORF Transcript_9175/g.15949 Transcript_9175/m.15949 type:complete len:97 (-) Transcript_9175:41-331(-)